MKKLITFTISILSIIAFTSCDSTLKIQMSSEGVRFSFNPVLGKAFTETISGVMGLTSNSNENQSLFNSEEMKTSLQKAGFTKVNARTKGADEFSVDFSPAKNSSDPLSKSGILKYDVKLTPYIHLSKENLTKLYEYLPFELQSYIDMLMSPSFTGEEMTDEEYLDLIASVYGQKLSDEVKTSRINFVFVQGDKQKSMSLSLLSVLNTTGDLFIKN